jgi:hypothetical protein
MPDADGVSRGGHAKRPDLKITPITSPDQEHLADLRARGLEFVLLPVEPFNLYEIVVYQKKSGLLLGGDILYVCQLKPV